MKIPLYLRIVILFMIFSVVLIFVQRHLEFTHSIHTKGILFAESEWILQKSSNGNLSIRLHHHKDNTISRIQFSEFERGDFADFQFNKNVQNSAFVEKGDTIAQLVSFAEHRRLLDLQDLLQTQQSLLRVYQSGDKTELIEAHFQRMKKASQEWQIEQQVFDRTKSMFEVGHIPAEEFELAENAVFLKEQNYLIAKSAWEASKSGEKQEQIDFALTQISSLKNRIEQQKALLDSYTIVAPLSGKIIRESTTQNTDDALLRIADTSSFIVLAPVEIYLKQYLEMNQTIQVLNPITNESFDAQIISFENRIQNIHQKQYLFFRARLVADNTENFLLNMSMDIQIQSEPLTLFEYIKRFVNEVYNN